MVAAPPRVRPELRLLEPLNLGGLILPNRILQAPLAGYSNASFRRQCRRIGFPGFVATEMISARALVRGCRRNREYLFRRAEEGLVQYQLWGTEPDVVGEAARLSVEAGADLVDLNCGCPVRKVNASGAGVVFMHDPDGIARCVRAMRSSSEAPVSVKIRVGPSAARPNAPEVAQAAEEAGADFLTLHGRHGKEAYNMPVRYDAIARIVEERSIPVIGNGNVRDAATAARMVRETDCAGVMIGRACMGNPWVFAEIRARLSVATWIDPTPAERAEALLRNFHDDVDLMGPERATRHIRKLACFYSKTVRGSREFRREVNRCSSIEAFEETVRRHFISPGAPDERKPEEIA